MRWLPAALALAGCGRAPEEIDWRAMAPGEKVTFALRFIGTRVGEGTLELGGSGGELTVTSSGSLAIPGLYRAAGTLVDSFSGTGEVRSSDQEITENGARRHETFSFDASARTVTRWRERDGLEPDEATFETVAPTDVIVSAVYRLRLQPLAVGASRTLQIFAGREMKELEARAVASRELKTRFGPLRATEIVIGGEVSQAASITDGLQLYLSENETRLPVRLVAHLGPGVVELDAVDWQR